MNNKIKPKVCPFCGKIPEVYESNYYGYGMEYAVECVNTDCHISVIVDKCESEEMAIELWNIRC